MTTLDFDSAESIRALTADAPDLPVEKVLQRCANDPVLTEVMQDYVVVCSQMEDDGSLPEDRTQLAEIRAGLVAELRRRLNRPQT